METDDRLALATRIVLASAAALCLSAAGASAASDRRPASRQGSEATRPPLRLQETCVTRAERRRVVRFSAGDAVRLLGVEFGRGPNGIVLAHQGGGGAPGNLCAWVPYARRLARAGHHVLVFDHRAHGSSDLPSSGRRAEQVDLDVVAAVRILRRRGATAIVLGGASLGGTAVLAAAARIEPAVQGVFSIAAPLVFGPSDGLAAVRTLALPALFMSAAEDGTFAEEARELYAACPSAQKRLEIVPGTEHGAPVLRSASARTLVDTWIGERFAATPSRSTAAATPSMGWAISGGQPVWRSCRMACRTW